MKLDAQKKPAIKGDRKESTHRDPQVNKSPRSSQASPVIFVGLYTTDKFYSGVDKEGLRESKSCKT